MEPDLFKQLSRDLLVRLTDSIETGRELVTNDEESYVLLHALESILAKRPDQPGLEALRDDLVTKLRRT